MKQKSNIIVKILQGSLIGLGAVLPGISGGVLCVVFGVYKTIMEFLANPVRTFKTHVPKLIPIGIGSVIGFMGVAKILSVLLEKYPAPSVCLFIGLIVGMMPSLFREAGEQGRSKASFVGLGIAMVIVFVLLISLQVLSVSLDTNFGAYVFCGCCLAISVIAPGMSFSTLLMPLDLYEPFVAGIGNFDFSVLLPGGIGALATVILLSKAVNMLFDKYYSVAFHAIIGVVIAATIMIIPVASFMASVESCIVNIVMLAVGVVCAFKLDAFNQKYTSKD